MADNSEKIKLLSSLLQQGKITKEMYDDNMSKVLTLNKNLRPDALQRTGTLSDVISSIKDQGGMAKNVMDEVKVSPNSLTGIKADVVSNTRFPSVQKMLSGTKEAGLLKNTKGFSKMLPMLGMGATALAGMSIANKAMAGDVGEAGLEAADLATDYVPGVGQVKMAMRPTELGQAELPNNIMEERRIFNEARKSKEGEMVNNPSQEQPLLAPEDRAKYEDMQSQFKNIMSRLKK